MKRKVKRKCTRRETSKETVPDSLQSISSLSKEESSRVDGVTGEITEVKPATGFSFNDLPASIRLGVENTIKARARLHLPDDSKERRERAVKYFRGDRLR